MSAALRVGIEDIRNNPPIVVVIDNFSDHWSEPRNHPDIADMLRGYQLVTAINDIEVRAKPPDTVTVWPSASAVPRSCERALSFPLNSCSVLQGRFSKSPKYRASALPNLDDMAFMAARQGR